MKKKTDILFRIYWNNDALHDFDIGDDHICSESLIANELSERFKYWKNMRWTAQRIEGGCETIRFVARSCKKYNLHLQISNEMVDKVGFNAPSDVHGWIKNRLERILDEVGFKDYHFKLAENVDVPKGISSELKKEYPIIICGPDHEITSELYCRALTFTYGDFGGGDYTQLSAYGGIINNFKWVPILDVLGDCWVDKGEKIKDYLLRSSSPMEFAKGEFPPYSVTSKSEIRKVWS